MLGAAHPTPSGRVHTAGVMRMRVGLCPRQMTSRGNVETNTTDVHRDAAFDAFSENAAFRVPLSSIFYFVTNSEM